LIFLRPNQLNYQSIDQLIKKKKTSVFYNKRTELTKNRIVLNMKPTNSKEENTNP